MIKLSIIIPLYNSEKYISNCLESLLDQDILRDYYEIIIIDDGSSDDSLSIVKDYEINNANIIVRSQKNKGAGAARNHGIKIAKGEFLYFVDSDDYIASKVLKKLIDYLNDYIELLTFKIIETNQIDLKTSRVNYSEINSLVVVDGLKYIEQHGYRPSVGWFFIRKTFLTNADLFYPEGQLLEDISFNLELFTRVKKVIFLPIDVYRYVHRPNSTMTIKNSIHTKKMILDYEKVVLEFEKKINKLRDVNSKAVIKLIRKQGIYHFFLFMRLMRSDISVKEINKLINIYKESSLYPLKYYSNSLKVKILIFVFNRKYLFYPFLKIYRFLSKKAL